MDTERADTATLGATAAAAPEASLAGVLVEGSLVGRYRILGLLGAGGMGRVYRAHDPELDRLVAIKVLRQAAGAGSAQAVRMQREAQAMARLKHANIATVFDVGTVGGEVFIAVEFIDGVPLGAWARQEPSPRRRLDALIAAGRGLAAAHAAGVIHRDFKPDNVLVARDGGVYVIDFGLARSVDAVEGAVPGSPGALAAGEAAARNPVATGRGGAAVDTLDAAAATLDACDPALDATIGAPPARAAEPPREVGASSPHGAASGRSGAGASGQLLSADLTATGAFLGTPAYMPLEQLDGAAVDARADQFAFAVTAWEVLYGERPFAGDTLAGLIASVRRGQPRQPGRPAAVPARADAALRRALSVEPSARFPSMAALLAELANEPVVAPRAHRRQRLVVAVTALVVVLAVVAGLEAWRRSPTDAGPPVAASAVPAESPQGRDVTSREVLDRARSTVAAHLEEVKACYATARAADAALGAGRVVIRFDTDERGGVRRTGLVADSFDGAQGIARCLLKASLDWTFGPSLAAQTFEYPFNFKP